jgi:UDP-glucose 4-epimerase
MKKAIVFGANGYLGRHLIVFLVKNKITVIPTDVAETSIDNLPNYIPIDITNKAEFNKLDFNVDYVFAFAGLTGTSNSPEIIEKFTQVNEQGLINILDNCIHSKPKVIFPSTRLVYKGLKDTPLKETSEKEAKTVYAKNKINCENFLKEYYNNHQINSTVFRVCVPYGNLIDTTYSYGTVGFFIGKAANSNNIPLYGDGSLKRTFTHIADICTIIIEASQLNVSNNKTYNIGSNDSLSLLEAAQVIATKYKVDIDFVDWPEEALKIESGDTIFDDSQIQEVISYKYMNTFKNWVKEI